MSDMRGYVTPASSINISENAGKIIGAAVVALAIATAGIYSYESGMWKVQPVTHSQVSDSSLPTATAPASPGTPR
ncbi:MAG TPA: hypothetical protein VHU87_08930 [Rhizomicrobium sp.]|jgi:hypothetical protein|nr:hypothetical protein [Rhizomicrobium sp.]